MSGEASIFSFPNVTTPNTANAKRRAQRDGAPLKGEIDETIEHGIPAARPCAPAHLGLRVPDQRHDKSHTYTRLQATTERIL